MIFMEFHEHVYKKTFLIAFFLLAVNLLVLDLWEFKKSKISTVQKQAAPSPVSSCPQNCLSEIKTATSSLSFITPSVSKQTTTSTASTVKEFYLPLGSGTNATDDWSDVVGAQIYADPSRYTKIKQVVFEASVRVPNANEDVYVRLYNDTDKHAVWFSDLFFPSGTTSNFLVSPPITLDPGNKLYKVQMKTQLKATANLDQARIHINTY